MKRALSVAMLTVLTLLTLLPVGYAQEARPAVTPDLLDQQLRAMESVFGALQSFMGELVTEVKMNMRDVTTLDTKLTDLKNVVTAVSIQIKQAEGQIIGLKGEVSGLTSRQQELRIRVVALEAGLSELAAFCDQMKALLDGQGADLQDLRTQFDALVDAFGVHIQEFASFRTSIVEDMGAMNSGFAAQIEALRAGCEGDLTLLRTEVYDGFDALQTGVYGEIDALQTGVYGEIDALRENLGGTVMTLESTFSADITLLETQYGSVAGRVKSLEDEDVGTFKRKVMELERAMAAVAIKVDNNRAKLEGFDYALATMSGDMVTLKEGILEANRELLGEYDLRLKAVEDNATFLKKQIDTLYFISIVGLLAGVGALIWGFMGNSS